MPAGCRAPHSPSARGTELFVIYAVIALVLVFRRRAWFTAPCGENLTWRARLFSARSAL